MAWFLIGPHKFCQPSANEPLHKINVQHFTSMGQRKIWVPDMTSLSHGDSCWARPSTAFRYSMWHASYIVLHVGSNQQIILNIFCLEIHVYINETWLFLSLVYNVKNELFNMLWTSMQQTKKFLACHNTRGPLGTETGKNSQVEVVCI